MREKAGAALSREATEVRGDSKSLFLIIRNFEDILLLIIWKISGKCKERGCGSKINSVNLSPQLTIKDLTDLKHGQKKLKYLAESFGIQKNYHLMPQFELPIEQLTE